MSDKVRYLNYITLILAITTLVVSFYCYTNNYSYNLSYFFALVTLGIYLINRLQIDKETNLSKKDKEMLQDIKKNKEKNKWQKK